MNENEQEFTAAGPWTAILDRETIEALRELGGEEDPHLLEELLELYLVDTLQRIAAVVEADVQGDLEVIRQQAHALKSASANIGALQFSEQWRTIETLAREGAPVSEAIGRMQEMFSEVEHALAELGCS